MTPDAIPIIRTEILERVESALEMTGNMAELCLIRGNPGIGKSVAIDGAAAEFHSRGWRVAQVTASPEIAGSMRAFFNCLAGSMYGREGTASGAVEVCWSLLARRVFEGDEPRPSLLIVDEAQMLSVPIMESLRALWDRGDPARQGRRSDRSCFAMVLVGNHQFLNRRGQGQAAEWEPLTTRVFIDLRLPPPGTEDCAKLAAALCPADAELRDQLAAYGAARGSLRAIAKLHGRMCQLAGADAPTLKHLKLAKQLAGGR